MQSMVGNQSKYSFKGTQVHSDGLVLKLDIDMLDMIVQSNPCRVHHEL